MAPSQELYDLVWALSHRFGINAPTLSLRHPSQAPREGKGYVHARYIADVHTIQMWVRCLRVLTHEWAHALQQVRGGSWPVPKGVLKEQFPHQFAAAQASLAAVRSAYTQEELEDELFARVFERVYEAFL